jgi:peptide/nickel transport system substrate-binding protein
MIVIDLCRRIARAAAGCVIVAAAIGSPAVAQEPSAGSSDGAVPEGCQRGGTLTMGRQTEPASLAPWDSTGNGNIFFQMQIYDRLVEQLPGSLEVQPGLADSWEIAPDGLSYTFHIRDATFSNGDPVTIEDVKFSLDQMIDDQFQVDWGFLFPNVKGFEIVDDQSIRMDMNQVDASILWSMTLPAGGIIPKAVFEELGADGFQEAPVGSGAFMLKSRTLGQSIEVEANPYHWREGQPYLDGVNFLYIPDATARALKIQAGEADIVEDVPYAQVASIDALDDITVQVQPLMVGWYVTLNNSVPPLDEKVVRQALNYATPRDVINDVALAGLGTPSNSMIVQRGAFWDDTVPPYPYDLAKAQELMAQSSVPDGFDLEIHVLSTSSENVAAAQVLQAEWAKIGVNVSITTVDPAQARELRESGEFQGLMYLPTSFTSDSFDDHEIASLFLDYSDRWKSWFSRYNSPEASRLVEEANSTVDNEERAELYSELQKLAMDDSPWVTLLNAPTTNAVKDNVRGFQALPVGWWRLEDVCFAAS